MMINQTGVLGEGKMSNETCYPMASLTTRQMAFTST